MEPYGGAINWMLKTASKLLNEKERSKFVRFVQVQEAEFHKTNNENKNCCNTQENKIILNQIGKTGWIKKGTTFLSHHSICCTSKHPKEILLDDT